MFQFTLLDFLATETQKHDHANNVDGDDHDHDVEHDDLAKQKI